MHSFYQLGKTRISPLFLSPSIIFSPDCYLVIFLRVQTEKYTPLLSQLDFFLHRLIIISQGVGEAGRWVGGGAGGGV